MGLPSGRVEGIRLDAAPSDMPAVQEGQALAAGVPLERDILGGETHEYKLPVPSGTLLFLEVQPAGKYVEMRLLGPDGESLARAEGRDGAGTTRLLALITDHSGEYRVTVTAQKQQTLPSRYRLTLRVLRAAKADDPVLVKAAGLLAEARRLRSTGTDEASRLAVKKAEQSLPLWKAVGDEHCEVETLAEIGGSYGQLGQREEALRWHQKALERARTSHYPAGEAWALGNLAYNSFQAGRNEEAKDLYLESVAAWRPIGRISELAFVLQGLGKLYLKMGDYDAALASFQEAYSLVVQARDPVEQANALSGIGTIHYYRGQLSEASKITEQSLELSRAMGDADGEAVSENNLASIHHARGQLQKAALLYTRLLERVPAKDRGVIFYNVGALYLELGDPEKALENYENAQETYRKAGISDGEVKALTGIGWTRQRMGDPQAALAACDQARKLLPKESWDISHYRGLALLDLGQLQQALESIERAVKFAQTSSDVAREAWSLLALGSVYRALKKPDLAIEQLNRAIEMGRSIEAQNIVAPGLLERAALLRGQGRLDQALSDIEAAVKTIESVRRNIAGQQIRTAFFASRQSYYELYIDLLMELAERHPEKSYRAEALAASERSHARGLLDLLAEGRIDLSQGLDPDLKERDDRLTDELARIQTELRTKKPSPGRITELRSRLDELDRLREQLDWEIRARNPRYAQVLYSDPLTLREIQEGLDEKAALVEYFLGERRSLLFVVTKEGLSSYELPPASTIAEQVLRLRKALERESPLTRATFLDSAFRLYKDLLAPAEEVLARKPELIIVPDRDLYYVPFEALLTEPGGDRLYRDLPYLLHRHSIAYVPSASVLAGLRAPEPKGSPRERLVAFAPFATPARESGVSRDGSGEAGFWSSAPLPASGREVAGITALYAGAARQFLNGEATEENVKQNPVVAAAGRLHFATHASPDERHPELSALILARPDGRPGDGLLQVHEIFNLKLSADLVVLSACQTALGKRMTGEGLIGLTRAFFYAGVPSLVVSLWNVTDGPTPELMVEFYRDLDQSGNKATALRSAKRAMIERKSYSHPSYWAPFILLGRPG